MHREYVNKFRIKINDHDNALRVGELYGGYLIDCPKLPKGEYWYITSASEETIRNSILIEVK